MATYLESQIFRHFRKLDIYMSRCTRLRYSTSSETIHNGTIYDSKARDPAPYFFNNQIQSYLRCLTRLDINRVYRRRQLGEKRLETPEYKFLTKEQLDDHLREAFKNVDQLLQMPPVVKVREEIDVVLSNDPQIDGYDTDNAKLVFVDISPDTTDRNRLIVIREPTGALRKANWDVRTRMNHIYNPQPGHELLIPRMFTDNNFFGDLLKRLEHEFILDRACVQFDPDDELYQSITSQTYDNIDQIKNFDLLRSTRHFGPLAFYLTWFGKVDNLLIELLENRYGEEVDALMKLFYDLNDQKSNKKGLDLLTNYLDKYCVKKAAVSLAMKAFVEYQSVGREEIASN